MVSQDTHNQDGVIIESLPNSMYRVKMNDDGRLTLATVSGKMRINRIRVLPGDKVKMEFTPYDQERGRIVFKYKN
jgi:translation initiation factor IF-1